MIAKIELLRFIFFSFLFIANLSPASVDSAMFFSVYSVVNGKECTVRGGDMSKIRLGL